MIGSAVRTARTAGLLYLAVIVGVNHGGRSRP